MTMTMTKFSIALALAVSLFTAYKMIQLKHAMEDALGCIEALQD